MWRHTGQWGQADSESSQIRSLCRQFILEEDVKVCPHQLESSVVHERSLREPLRNILQFLYQGEVNIEQAHLEEFVKISNELEIIGMTSLKSKNEKNEDFAKENDCPEGSDRDIVEYSEISRVVPKNYENMDTSQISRGLEEKLDVKMSVRSKSYMSMDHIYTDIDKQDDSTEDNDESLLAKVVDEVKKPDGRIDCNLCNKTFKNKNSLKVHKYRFHTGEKILQESLIIMT